MIDLSPLFRLESKASGRAARLKKAVLASFRSTPAEVEARFAGFDLSDWRWILYWLDISGLALYLLARLTELGLERCLPEPILERLKENLAENRERTDALLREAAAISRALTRQRIAFALLKGITLTPDSVPDSALRWQIDLDFLVAACDATAARHVLMSFGYGLHAVCGNTMEFTAGYSGAPDIRKIYRIHSQRSLELHMLSTTEGRNGRRSDRLSRTQLRSFQGTWIPTLTPADILVQQSVHLFKHLCGEHTRASWVLEFWRHVEARRNDTAFWSEVERIAAIEPQAEIALAAAVLLSTLTFGGAAPDHLALWATDRLPHKVRLWVETFGPRVLLADSAGNKLYLILRQELRGGKAHRPTIRRLVFPAHLPPPITRAAPGERLRSRLARYRTESYYLFLRLQFHVVEGLKYAIELSLWQRRVTETSK
ncbi:MAG: nucleotidyltransferase family protein [Terracidiphilus sp.]